MKRLLFFFIFICARAVAVALAQLSTLTLRLIIVTEVSNRVRKRTNYLQITRSVKRYTTNAFVLQKANANGTSVAFRPRY